MENIIYQKFDEEIIRFHLENGLEVQIIQKANYYKKVACLTTKFGSLNLYLDENKITKTGIAHFLEHMLFNNEELNIEEKFASKGAYLNAFTSLSSTAYYFQGSDDFSGLLFELLNFVLNPNFSMESVEKERLIIVEELKMYMDKIQNRLVNCVMPNLYDKHPLKYDIGGLIEDVMEISIDDLEEVYKHFYHPSNMTLIITGDVETEVVKYVLNKFFSKNIYQKQLIPKFYPSAKNEIMIKEQVIDENRSTAKVALGYKFDFTISHVNLKILLNIFLSLAISEISDFYEESYEKELIDHSFSYYLTVLSDTASLVVLNGTKKAEEYLEAIQSVLQNYVPSLEDFNKFKKKYIGSTYHSLNSLDSIMYETVLATENDMLIFSNIDILNELSYQDIIDMNKYFSDNYTYTIIK